MKSRVNWPAIWLGFKIGLIQFGAMLIYIAVLLLVMLAVLILPGCQSSTKPLQAPSELLVRCPDLTPIEEGSAGAVAWKIVEVAGEYYACQARLDALIDAVTRF